MIVERNDGSIIEGEIIIQLFAINCKMMQGLKWILAKVEHLKLINEKIKWTNVETKCHKEYEKQPLKILTSTTRFKYVPNGRKKKFQNCRCRDASSHWMMEIF